MLLAEIEDAPSLAGYAPLYAAKGDFLMRLQRMVEARAAFERAAGFSDNAVERAFLMGRVGECREPSHQIQEASGDLPTSSASDIHCGISSGTARPI